MKKKWFLIVIIIAIFGVGIFFYNKKNIYINIVLSQSSYNYLPKEAKNDIKEVYNKTGNVLKTEKNKEKDNIYLNPKYVNYLTMSKENNKEEIPVPVVVDYTNDKVESEKNIPDSYDLRNIDGKNYITPVRDQGNLGICWTFATAGAMESKILKENYSNNQTLISERQIDYATSTNGIKDYRSEYISFISRGLGEGGNFYIATVAMANGISLYNYNAFKEFNDEDLDNMELSDVLSYKKSSYEVDSTINMETLNLRESSNQLTESEKITRTNYLNDIKTNIMKNGAAYLGTYMNNSCIYKDKNINGYILDVYNCSKTGGHAMQIIGWDDNKEYSYCADNNRHTADISSCKNKVIGKGVWILKNSWGDLTPYLYLTYDSLDSTIGFINEIKINKEKTWDNNYVLANTATAYKEKSYVLSKSKIKNQEILKKVKFFALTPNTEYTIRVFKEDYSFETFKVSSDKPGLITLNLNKDVIVNKDCAVNISTNGSYIDSVSVFTKNIDTSPYIDSSSHENKELSTEPMRLYSETKNIPSGAIVDYKLYNSKNEDVTSYLNISNNVIAENNINTIVSLNKEIKTDKYRMDIIYDSSVISSFNLTHQEQNVLGTKNNPYIITTPTELSNIRNNPSAYYELGNDIDLSEATRKNGELENADSVCNEAFGWESINNFNGYLDGKGHSIKGLYQNNNIMCNDNHIWRDNSNGLINYAYGNVTIKNIILEDFDITCQGAYCGGLISNYKDNENSNDTTEANLILENIVFKNNKITGVYNDSNIDSSYRTSYGGGLLGNIESKNGAININNIYLDNVLEVSNFIKKSSFIETLFAKEANISNIRLGGTINGKYGDGSGDSIFNNKILANTNVDIKNIFSSVDGNNISGNFFGDIYSDNINVSNIKVLKINDNGLCRNDTNCFINDKNVFYEKSDIKTLLKKENYAYWDNFDDNWIIKTVNGIPRFPVLKNISFEYTNINNITYQQELNKKDNIYNYITPNYDIAKRISYKSNNLDIIDLDESGNFIPKKTGNTTIHVESLYDGYINDVPISVSYLPHYNIKFDSNGGTGVMKDIEVSTEENYTLPDNAFIKENYKFKSWNTKKDGTGKEYSNLAQIEKLNDKETLILYAQWIGNEITITFDANGGVVTPTEKKVRYGENYGELPIPVKNNNAFLYWTGDNVIVDVSKKISARELSANWKENAYTIIYNANGGRILENSNSNYKIMSDKKYINTGDYNKESTILNNYFQKSGSKFKEWNTMPDGTGTAYEEVEKINLSNIENSQLNLYAIWENEKGIITFNSNDKNNNTKEQIVTLNENIKLDSNTFKRDGYEFVEWNTESDGTGDKYSDGEIISLSKNVTLYAIWKESFIYKINNYAVDEVNNYISKIMVDTTIENFKKNIELNKLYNIDIEYKIKDNKKIIHTGSKTKILKDNIIYKEYTNVIIGDINGDGVINSADLLKIRQHLLGINKLNGPYFLSSDINYDNTINSADLLKIRQHLLNVKRIDGGK